MPLRINWVKNDYYLLHRYGVYYLFKAPHPCPSQRLVRAWENYVNRGDTGDPQITCVGVSRNHDELLRIAYKPRSALAGGD